MGIVTRPVHLPSVRIPDRTLPVCPPPRRSRHLRLVLILLTLGAIGLALAGVDLVPWLSSEPLLPAVRVRELSITARFPTLAPESIPAFFSVAPDGAIVIADRTHASIVRIGSDGQLLGRWGPRLAPDVVLQDVAGIAALGSDVFVLDPVAKRIIRLDATGRPTTSVSFQAIDTYGPGALAVDGAGRQYVADTGGNRILVFDPDGGLLQTLGSTGSAPGHVKQPMALAWGPDGALYVADWENARIAHWDGTGRPAGGWSTQFRPWGVAVDARGRVYVPEADTRRVLVYAPDGTQVADLGGSDSPKIDLQFPSQVALGPDGSTLWILGHDGLARATLQEFAAPARGATGVLWPAMGGGILVTVAALGWRAWRRSSLAVDRVARTAQGQQAFGRWEPLSGARSVARLLSTRRVGVLRVGLGLWLLALVLAFAGQAAAAPGQPFDRARPLHLAAALVALLAVLLIERHAPPAGAHAVGIPLPEPRLRPKGLLVASMGTLLVLGAIPVLVARVYVPATGLWLAGLVLLQVGTLWAEHSLARPHLPRLGRESVLLLGILMLTLALRLPGLSDLPPDVHGDEAAIGIGARGFLSGATQDLFGVGWFDTPNLSFAIPAVFMWLFGNDLFGLRLASVAQGTGAVLLTYLLGRRLFGARAGLLAAFLLAIADMHVHYSRTGFHYMQAGFATVLVLYLVVRALDTRRLADFVGLGLACGLCLGLYPAARLAPVLVAAYVAVCLLRNRALLRGAASGLGAAVLAGVLFVAPMVPGFLSHPEGFNSRAAEVWLLTPENLRHEMSAYGVASVGEVLGIQGQRTLEAFTYSGGSGLQYAHRGPLLDPWTGGLFVLGVGAFAFRVRRRSYGLLAAWLWSTLILGAVLTLDAPFSPHLVGMLPVLALLPALSVDAGWRAAAGLFGRSGKAVVVVCTAGVLTAALVANVRDYREVQVVQEQPAGFFTVLSRYAREVNGQYRVYLVSRPDTSLGYETVRFLVPDLDGVDLRDAPLTSPFLPVGSGIGTKGAAFIVEAALPDFAARLEQLRQAYPGGRAELHRSTRGDLLFASYLVDASRG